MERGNCLLDDRVIKIISAMDQLWREKKRKCMNILDNIKKIWGLQKDRFLSLSIYLSISVSNSYDDVLINKASIEISD